MGHDARWWKAGAMLLSTAVGVTTSRAVHAGEPPVPSRIMKPTAGDPFLLTVNQALGLTSRTGRPTLIVVTERGAPDSQGLWEDLAARIPKGVDHGMSVVRLSREADPEPVRRLGVTRFPTVVVYRKGARGLETAGSRVQPRDAAEVLQWLGSTQLAAEPASQRDPAVSRTGLFHHPQAQPSPQAAAAPASVPTQAPVPAAAPAASLTAMPAQAPLVLATAPPPIVLQQAPQTVYVAPPAQPANIVVLAPPPAAPSISVVQPSGYGVTAGTPSLFLANPGAAVGVSPTVAPVTLAAMPVAPAPATTTAIAAIPAGPIGRFIGWIGERLARFKYPRVMTTTTTTTTATAAPAAVMAAPAGQPVQAVVPAAAPASYPTSQR